MLLEILVGVFCMASGVLLTLVSVFCLLKCFGYWEVAEELETVMFIVLSILIVSVMLIVFIILLSCSSYC